MASYRTSPLQLDHWANSNAPLSRAQRTSVNRLADWLHRNSAEYKVSAAAHHPTPTASTASTAPQPASRTEPAPSLAAWSEAPADAPPSATQAAASTAVALPDPTAPLSSAQDFLAWFTTLSASISSATQSSHQRALAEVAASTASASTLLSQLESCQINVSELRAGSAFVEDSSKELRDEAQALLEAQLHLEGLSDEIVSRLSFFTLLPYATALLSSPDASVVHSHEFLELLDQLEMALLFLQSPPARGYKDAALYRMRYAQCVTRGATLAKLAVCRGFKESGDNLAARLREYESQRGEAAKAKATAAAADADAIATASPPIPDELAASLFPSNPPLISKLRPLIHELERRAYPTESPEPADASADADADAKGATAAARPRALAANAPEFESLLDECRTAWFAARRPVVAKLVSARIAEIEAAAFAPAAAPSTATQGLERLSSLGLAAVRWFVDREVEAYRHFFVARPGRNAVPATAADLDADPLLRAHLQSLVDALQNRLRPRILKETRIDALSRIGKVFVDVGSDQQGGGSGGGKSEADGAAARAEAQYGAATALLSHSLLHEIQLRLIFRAQAVISSEIGGFVPREELGHLNFPEAIEAVKSQAEAQTEPESGVSLSLQRPSAHHQRGKSGAGLLDAALATSQTAFSASTAPSAAPGSGGGGKGAQVRLFRLPEATRASYYAPLVRLVDLLDQLQGLIAPRAFGELAHEGVESCRKAVERGGEALMQRQGSGGAFGMQRDDAWLFRIRQYEMLREVVVSVGLVARGSGSGGGVGAQEEGGTHPSPSPADANASNRGLVDLSSLAGAMKSLWSSTGRLLYPSSSGAGAGMDKQASTPPSTVNAALEAQLQTAMRHLASFWADSLTLPLSVYRHGRKLQPTPTPTATARANDPTDPENGHETSTLLATLGAVETCIAAFQGPRKLASWIEGDRLRDVVVQVLLEAVQERCDCFTSAVGAREVASQLKVLVQRLEEAFKP
ncbi:Golgi transport complex subunit 3 [Thecaphora frezii]